MKKRNGLKSKLMIYFMLCIIVPSLIIGYYTYKISYNSFIHKVDKELDRVLNFTMDKMDTKLEQIGMISKMVGQSKHIQEYGDELFVENVDELTYFRVNESIYSMKNRVSEMISDIYILDRYGKIVIGTRPSIISRDMSKLEFFNESINGRDYIGNMIQDSEGEDRTILHSQPLLNSKGQISGVVVLQLKFNVISDIIEESKFGETGFLYLTDRNGLVIQHKDEEKILKENLSKSPKSYKRQIGEEIEAGNRGSVRFDEDGVIKVSMYRSFDNFGIVATMDEKESFDFLYIVRKKIFAIFLLCIIIGMIASYFIAERMLRPISDLTDLTQKLGTGDLREKTKINSEDELGSLAEGINHMIDGQRNLIDKIIKASNKVNNMALEASSISQEMASSSEMQKGSLDDLKKVIDEITLSTKDVSNSVIKMAEGLKETSVVMDKIDIMIQEVSESVEETTITVGDVTGSMQEINSSIELIAENSHNASNQAKKTVQIANDGKEKINNTVEEMDKIDVEIKGLTKVIQGLGTSTMQIGDIVELIDDISEQTNLLALNASIEAARAGEHGRGFAVVAEAIGDLAEKAGEATKDISSLIKDVEKEVENAINKTSRGVEQVERGVNLVKGTGNSLDNIFVSIEKTTELINEIAYSTEQQSNASRFIMQMVEKVNSLALQVSMSVEEQVNSVNNVTKEVEKMASLSQEIAGATQQQFASSQEVLENIENVTMIASDTAFASQDVANTAQNLALEADSLMKNVEKFKI